MKLAPSLNKIKKTLKRVLFESDEPIVIAIKGGWGVGKTYFWKNTIAVDYESDAVGYLSVFGADSLQNIREKVVLAALPFPSVGSESNNKVLGRIRSVTKSLHSHLPAIVNKLGIPDKLITEILEDQLLKPGWVLCIDDIERLSDVISADTFLGYVNELRDERKLKVVLIYNPEKLGDKKDKYFQKYHEKVIDRQLPFIPDISETINLVFGSVSNIASNQILLDELCRRCEALELRNIRLLNKVRLYYQEVFLELPTNSDQDFQENALFSLLLFVWVKFAERDNKLPDFEYLLNYSEISSRMIRDAFEDKELSEKHEAADNLLSNFGYSFTDDLDKILIELIQTDVLDTTKLKEEYGKHVKNISLGKIEKRYTDVWKTHYHGNFKNSEVEFCSELESATEEFIDHININQLDSALKMLSQLNKHESAIRLLDLFVEKQSKTLERFHRSMLYSKIEFNELSEIIIQAEQKAKVDSRPISEVMDKVFKNDYYSSEDRERFSNFTYQEFLDYFLQLEGENTTLKLKHAYELTMKTSSPDRYEEDVQAKLRQVIDELAQQNKINQLRMESMGLLQRDANGEG